MSAPKTAFCTIVARNYLAYALALLTSVGRHHPESARYVLIVDSFDRRREPELEWHGIELVFPTDILPYQVAMGFAYGYDITEFSTSLKPFLLRHLLDRGHESVLYVDPDIVLFDSLDSAVFECLDDASIVLTPHTTDPIPLDGHSPTEVTLLLAGAYNLGFIGVRQTPETRRFLAWWADRLERFCLVAVERGLFVDQKWIDLVPGMFEGTRILRHRGLNVAYWNIHARPLVEAPTGKFMLKCGDPLLFFHFSGFDPHLPESLSRHQNRLQVAAEPVLAKLLLGYARELERFGHAERRKVSYAHSVFSDGTAVDATVRALLREARDAGLTFLDPRDVDSRPSLYDYCNATDPSDPCGSPRLTRYLAALHGSRPDLQAAFPAVRTADRRAFVDWARYNPNSGVDSNFVTAALQPPRDRSRGLPVVNVAGYFSAESGVGEAGRAHVAAVQAAGCDVHLVDVSVNARLSRQGEAVADGVDRVGCVNLVCVNADQVPHFAQTAGKQLLRGRYNIGSWWWELPEFPPQWHDRFDNFDELWVGSEYVRATLAAVANIPVVRIPPIVALPPVRDPTKERFGFPRDAFVFLYFFDYLSEFERKNPLGAVAAFKSAFPSNADVRLVIKAVNSQRDPENAARLRDACSEDPRVEIREVYLSRDEKNAMLAAADCYISLHRAEGFGLTIAEAMYLGTPVICTGWSGNTDFTDASNALIVDGPLISLERDHGPYVAGQRWADPDIDQAAHAMRRVIEFPREALVRAAAARRTMRVKYCAATVGVIARRRLSRVLDLRGVG